MNPLKNPLTMPSNGYGESARYPHCILHFDINKTLINSDSITGKTKEEVLINQLAETTSHIWNPNYPAMTYRQYVYQVLVPGQDSCQEVKRKRRDVIKNFLETVTNYPVVASEVALKYKRLLEKADDSIFTSFVKLIEKLQKCRIAFTLILRTFGNDLEEVAKEISKKAPVQFTKRGVFERGVLRLSGKENKTLKSAQDIFKKFSKGAHMAIRDDYSYWNENQEQACFGKKFVFETGRSTNLSLFFDDNLTGQANDIVAPYSEEGLFISTKELMNKTLFAVDTAEAIMDDEYYIKLINKALIANGYSSLI